MGRSLGPAFYFYPLCLTDFTEKNRIKISLAYFVVFGAIWLVFKVFN